MIISHVRSDELAALLRQPKQRELYAMAVVNGIVIGCLSFGSMTGWGRTNSLSVLVVDLLFAHRFCITVSIGASTRYLRRFRSSNNECA